MKKNKIKTIRKVGVDINNWDILDGRTKLGKPIKKVAKVIYGVFFSLAFLLMCGLLTMVLLSWILM